MSKTPTKLMKDFTKQTAYSTTRERREPRATEKHPTYRARLIHIPPPRIHRPRSPKRALQFTVRAREKRTFARSSGFFGDNEDVRNRCRQIGPKRTYTHTHIYTIATRKRARQSRYETERQRERERGRETEREGRGRGHAWNCKCNVIVRHPPRDKSRGRALSRGCEKTQNRCAARPPPVLRFFRRAPACLPACPIPSVPTGFASGYKVKTSSELAAPRNERRGHFS